LNSLMEIDFVEQKNINIEMSTLNSIKWSNMLEEKRQQFKKEDIEEEYANDDEFVINNTHSVIDVNAK
ncbi:7758_t:CDS:2, partial [Cetraspora pellucida]